MFDPNAFTNPKEITSHKTAIKRKWLSKPARKLRNDSRLKGRVLDYGCGYGDDADILDCKGYDPYYRSEYPVGPFDTIMCNYVLNVIEDSYERRSVLYNIADLLEDDGIAYITVRADKKKLNGFTSIGTWQGLIIMDLPILYKDSNSITYVFHKGNADCKMEVK